MAKQEDDFHEMDQILGLLGNPGRFQIIQFIVLAYHYVPLSMNDFMPIFYGLPPLAVRCIGDDTSHGIAAGLPATGVNPDGNNTIPGPVCHCPNGFAYEYPGRQWSIIGDMDLICERASLVQLASVIYFLGQMLSTPIFGWAADRFGRRPTLLFSNALYTVMTVGLVFSRDYVSFVLLRFFVGVARQGMFSSFFILMMEWIPPNRRGTWAALAELSYTVGVLLTTLVAYLLQNWTHIQAYLAAMTVFAVPLYWFAPESLTWLCLHKRAPEVVGTCSKIARFNNIHLADSTVEKILHFAQKSELEGSPKVYSFYECLRTPNVRRTTLLCCFSWLACYSGYLGLSYLSSEIASNVYLNLAINGILELIPICFAFAIASRFGRKLPLVVYFLVAGVCSIVAGSIPGTTKAQLVGQNVMAFLGRMCFVGTCCVIFVFTSELFPTVIRNNGFSLCSLSLRIGCVIAPLLPLLSTKVFKGSGFLLIGIVAILSAGASSMLRETKGQPFLDTIEDAERLGSPSPISLPEGLRLRQLSTKKNVSVIEPQPVVVTVPMPTRVRVD